MTRARFGGRCSAPVVTKLIGDVGKIVDTAWLAAYNKNKDILYKNLPISIPQKNSAVRGLFAELLVNKITKSSR